MSKLIERLDEVLLRTALQPKSTKNLNIEMLKAYPKLRAVVLAAEDACRSIPGMLPKIEEALAALEEDV